ncbi:MAG: PspA/IM30 family protein [Alphaproteobacteria bacterium]|nr:PspA/IM30 family protein [Alphaproteobacteria bacterium]
MSWSKVFTAIKGAVSETGESIADNQAIRIMDQELREAANEINAAKTQLTNVMAKRKGISRKVDELGKKITEHERYAGDALQKNDEGLAHDICERLGGFEEQLGAQNSILQSFTASEKTLKANLKKAEGRLKQLTQQQDVLKATEAVQKAQGAVANRFSGSSSKMGNAMGSLERIKKRQQERADRFVSAEELASEESGGDLDRRMKEAGIGGSSSKTDDIMARLKSQI